jgi:hypothetical protein
MAKTVLTSSFFLSLKKTLKVQDLLYAYLSEQKRLSIPGIGIFEMSQTSFQKSDNESSGNENPIQFTPDKNAQVEDNLLNFLKERTGKMKALAQSDLDSFIYNGTQLLNIGKPFEIPVIGVIFKSSDGKFSFHQGTAEPEQFLTDQTKRLVESHESDTSYKREKRKTISNPAAHQKKQILYIGLAVAVAIIIWIIYLLIPNQPDQNTTIINKDTTEQSGDTPALVQQPVVRDTANNNPPATTVGTSAGFEMVGQYMPQPDTIRKLYRLYKGRGHDVRIDSSEPNNLRLLFAFKRPLKDTSFIADSMRIWYRIKTRYFAPLPQ